MWIYLLYTIACIEGIIFFRFLWENQRLNRLLKANKEEPVLE